MDNFCTCIALTWSINKRSIFSYLLSKINNSKYGLLNSSVLSVCTISSVLFSYSDIMTIACFIVCSFMYKCTKQSGLKYM